MRMGPAHCPVEKYPLQEPAAEVLEASDSSQVPAAGFAEPGPRPASLDHAGLCRKRLDDPALS